mgnify:CR=1 FL=1
MKRATLLIVTMCFCVSPCIATIVISDTYEYDVKLESSESLLMLGGGADSIWAKDSSYVEIRSTFPLQIDVGGIGFLDMDDSSTLEYYGGEVASLTTYDHAQVLLAGGRIDYISSFQSVLGPNQTYIPHIEIVCKEHEYDSLTKRLTGVWMDDTTFNIQLVDQSGYDPVIENIFFTPEPATLLLMGLGTFLLHRRRG